MCTLIVAWRVFEEAPICVAANRDELVDRPSTPPAVRGEDPRVLAPRDERAGGTWLGYNEHGLLVAVTNRWVEGAGERSRGLLVDDALGEPTAAAALERVRAALADRTYAPFHLLLVDDRDCVLVENGRGEMTDSGAADESRDDGSAVDGDGNDGGAVDAGDDSDPGIDGHRVHHLDPGVHVVVNVGFDGTWFDPPQRPEAGRRQAGNAERVRAELQPRAGETAADWTRRAGEVLGDHDYGVCIHADGFGTRSSSLVRLGAERTFAHADGPPCQTPYEVVDETV